MREVVQISEAPAAIGPYSQATITFLVRDKIIFCSGQIPIDPRTGELAEGEIQYQTALVLRQLESVLKAAGATLEDVCKTTVFMANLGDFSAMNAVYEQYFPDNPPARSTVQVSKLPKGALIEIEAIAVI